MKTYKHLYERVCSYENLFLAYRKARKGKTKKRYVKDFEANLMENLLKLQEELINCSYYPKPLKTFIYRANIEDLKKFTINLLTDSVLCEKIGRQGREHVVKNLDYRVISKKMIDITQEKLDLKN